MLSAVTCRTHLAALFSPGATKRNGPSISESGLPSRMVTTYTYLSMKIASSSGHANVAR